MATVAVATLGCRLNQAEAESWAILLAQAGYQVVDFGPGADAYVVHTCTVTHVADRKSRQRLYQASRYRPGRVLATGCFVRRYPQEASRAGANVVQPGSGDLLAHLISLAPPGDAAQVRARPHWERAQVKVQEGCSLGCTYCIIPRVRGRPRSRPREEIAAEVEQRVALGYREVVLTGTLLGTYGSDLEPDTDLVSLVANLLERTNVPRLRLSSLLPGDITPGLLGLWPTGRLVPRFHLPLQSGSDTVLHRMGRRYTAEQFCQAVSTLRAAVPSAEISTDLLVGFPGETEGEFEASLALCREIGFARIHVFPYSPRSGTLAARFPKQVPGPTIKERCRRALALTPATSPGAAED